MSSQLITYLCTDKDMNTILISGYTYSDVHNKAMMWALNNNSLLESMEEQ